MFFYLYTTRGRLHLPLGNHGDHTLYVNNCEEGVNLNFLLRNDLNFSVNMIHSVVHAVKNPANAEDIMSAYA